MPLGVRVGGSVSGEATLDEDSGNWIISPPGSWAHGGAPREGGILVSLEAPGPEPCCVLELGSRQHARPALRALLGRWILIVSQAHGADRYCLADGILPPSVGAARWG